MLTREPGLSEPTDHDGNTLTVPKHTSGHVGVSFPVYRRDPCEVKVQTKLKSPRLREGKTLCMALCCVQLGEQARVSETAQLGKALAQQAC